MQDTMLSEKEIRLRCLGIAMNISQMQHQYDMQMWMQENKGMQQGAMLQNPTGPPAPPQLIEFFAISSDIFTYISDDENE